MLVSLRAFERPGRVAAAAVRPELPGVNVVLRVTRYAIRAQPELLRWPFVAGSAREARVSPRQREVRLLRVVELPDSPAHGGMTTCAVPSEAPFVYIVCRMAVTTASRRIAKLAGEVTLLAGYGGVKPGQREARAVMVEAQIRPPGRRAVACGAVGAELPAMHVIDAMAAHTGGVELLRGNRRRVTVEATDPGVRACQCPVPVPRVIERGWLPLHVDMTVVAVVAEPAGVRILTPVTAVAVPWNFRVQVARAVTVLALQPLVRTQEREARRLQMIESRGLPAAHRMARGAIRAPISMMNVICCMAGNAVLWRSLVMIRDVTLGACERRMRASERKSGLVVIEMRPPPGVRPVAGGTVPPQSSRMRIIADMTAGALARGIPIAFARRVTAGAGEPGMRAAQRKVGAIVIERGGIELHDVRLAPQMIHMTRAAL